ncbi:MAG: 2Fe-2S iron-sulfur cluster-binding protein [Myxococcota bacterium]|nr:2Fe-2S iron-sulfur cluster-binding protein [Myxococcota bacterium]
MKRLSTPPGRPVQIELDGEQLSAHEGEPIACALLANGETLFSRSIKYHRPRGPYCLAAACTHCLMRVDGVPNIYTCRTPVKEGMRIERQNAYPSAKVDLFQSIDWLFPRGLDHHEMFAGVPVAEKVMAKVARHLAGLGLLPDHPAPERLECRTLQTQVAIVGGGAAGLAAARVLVGRGIDFLLIERDAVTGGRLIDGPPETDAPAVETIPAAKLLLKTSVIGLFDDQDGKFFAAISYSPQGPRLLKIRALRLLVTTGGHPAVLPFENNDLPGVMAGRAATRLIRRHQLRPGSKVALVGTGVELESISQLVASVGMKLQAVVEVRGAPSGQAVAGTRPKAHGRSKVSGFSYQRADGKTHKVSCDTVLVCMPPSPSFELARQGGARITFSEQHGVFVVEADAVGRTHAPTVFVAGELLSPTSAREAALSGQRAGEAIAGEVA